MRVDEQAVVDHLDRLFHVLEQTANTRREVYDLRRLD